MRYLLLLFLSILFPLNGQIPHLHQGRIVPLCEPVDSQRLLLPGKDAQWHPLSALTKSSSNFTLYSDPLFEDLRKAYQQGLPLNSLLEAGYQEILEKGEFPSPFQLKVDRWLTQFPWVILCLIGYGVSLFFLPVLWGTVSLHALILIGRSYVLERPFVTDMNESILFVSWIMACIALFLPNFKRWVIAAAAVTLGCALLLNDQRSLPLLPPVLNSSYWLTIHVLVVTSSYAALLVAGVLGHLYLVKPMQTLCRPLFSLNSIGLFLLMAGTILGGVWATMSWGRFWDWDPKETWAFISICFYLVSCHAFILKKIRWWGLSFFSALGIPVILFTWYGVNYILGTGLHSYGFGSAIGQSLFWGYIGIEFLFFCYAVRKRLVLMP